MSYKKSKKLHSFFKDKSSASKKYKSISQFLSNSDTEEATIQDHEEFLTQHHEAVFTVLQNKFAEFEEAAKKGGKSLASVSDLLLFLELLKKLLNSLKNLRKLRFRMDSTALFLRRCLHRANSGAIRVAAFDVLMVYILDLQNAAVSGPISPATPNVLSPATPAIGLSAGSPTPPTTSTTSTSLPPSPSSSPKPKPRKQSSGTSGQTSPRSIVGIDDEYFFKLFGCAIDLRIFASASEILRASHLNVLEGNDPSPPLSLSKSSSSSSVGPGGSQQTSKRTIEMFEQILNMMSASETHFQFWYRLFREQYMSGLYPATAAAIGIRIPEYTLQFIDGCPPDIHALIVDKVGLWYDSQHMSSVLWERDNAPLMMEIMRQSMLLPIRLSKTIRKAMNVYRNWLLNFSKMKLFGDQLQPFWQQFVLALSSVFVVEVGQPTEVEGYRSLYREVISIYMAFHSTLNEKMDHTTWETLLNTLLGSTRIAIVKRSDEPLVDLLMRRTFFMWLASTQATQTMWTLFSKTMKEVLNWPGTAQVWRERMVELTKVLITLSKKQKPATATAPTSSPLSSSGSLPLSGSQTTTSPVIKEEVSAGGTLKRFDPVSARDFPLLPHMMSWDLTSAVDVWYTALYIFGHIPRITNAEIYAVAVSTVHDMVIVLVDEIETNQNDDYHLFTDLIHTFMPWLFEICCDMTRLTSTNPQGVYTGYRALCKILCSRSLMFGIETVSHFYTTLHVGLQTENRELCTVILNSSAKIFTMSHPGITIMIPIYLRTIHMQFISGGSVSGEVEASSIHIINSLISQFIHFGDIDFVGGFQNPKLEQFKIDELNNELAATFISVLKRVSSNENLLSTMCGACVLICGDILHNQPRREFVVGLISPILKYCQHNSDSVAQNSLEILSSLACLHNQIMQFDKTMVMTIVNNLCESVITHLQGKDAKLRENIIAAHFWCLIEWLVPVLEHDDGDASDFNLLGRPAVLAKVLQSIEGGIAAAKQFESPVIAVEEKGEKFRKSESQEKPPAVSPVAAATTPVTTPASKKHEGRESATGIKMMLSGVGSGSAIGKSLTHPHTSKESTSLSSRMFRKKDKDKEKPDHKTLPEPLKLDEFPTIPREADTRVEEKRSSSGTDIEGPLVNSRIKEAAQALLRYILNHYQMFPLPSGADTMGSNVKEDEGIPLLHFIYKSKSIWSLCDVPSKQGNTTRVIIRDATGKYSWTMNEWDVTGPSIDRSADVSIVPPPIATTTTTTASLPVTTVVTPRQLRHTRSRTSIGAYRGGVEDAYVFDVIDDHIRRCAEKYPDSVPSIWRKLNDQTRKLTKEASRLAKEGNAAWLSPASSSELIPPPSAPNPLRNSESFAPATPKSSSYPQASAWTEALTIQSQLEEQFRQHMNQNSEYEKTVDCTTPETSAPLTVHHAARVLLTNMGYFEPNNRRHVVLIEESSKLRRSLEALDRINERETLKIGVMYVGPGQTKQNDILGNTQGSEQYNAFLTGLGWKVDLNTHRGFKGGLEPSVNGQFALYYATSIYEVIYHVVTMMPCNDEKHLHKKRHVGNDSVHIIWCENTNSEYDPFTINSQFNDAHIVINPLPNGLFRIRIHRKAKLQFFGPLVNEIVVDKRVLPMLVRQTAINASKSARLNVKGYSKPFSSRQDSIIEIAERNTTKKNYDEFFSSMFITADNLSPSGSRNIHGSGNAKVSDSSSMTSEFEDDEEQGSFTDDESEPKTIDSPTTLRPTRRSPKRPLSGVAGVKLRIPSLQLPVNFNTNLLVSHAEGLGQSSPSSADSMSNASDSGSTL